MTVRPATLADLEVLTRLRVALWPGDEGEHRDEARDLLSGRPRSAMPLVVFVAEASDAVLGFVEVGLRSHADGCDPRRPCGFLEGWYVVPEARGRGVGRRLVERAEQWAREQGCVEMASDTWLDNEPSQRAHLALGYQAVDRCVNFRKVLGGEPRASAHYGRELARLHHAHFGMVARAAARELSRRLRHGGGTVIDLAAGSGILSRALSDAGYEVRGVDISEDMLHLARTEAPGAHFTCASLWEVELPRCVAVAAVGEAFCYATDERAGLESLARRLDDIHRALTPGGLLLFDVAGPGRSGPARSRRVFWSYDEAALGMEEHEGETLARTITVFAREGERFRRVQERHVLRLYAPEDIERLLRERGFTAERLSAYDDFTFPAGWQGFAATKR